MSKKHIVFISLPMSGLSEEQIKENLSKARAYYLCHHDEPDIFNVAFVDNMNADQYTGLWGTKPEYMGVKRVGVALCRISACDEVMFYPGWEKARGCVVERCACLTYGIPVYDMEERSKRND